MLERDTEARSETLSAPLLVQRLSALVPPIQKQAAARTTGRIDAREWTRPYRHAANCVPARVTYIRTNGSVYRRSVWCTEKMHSIQHCGENYQEAGLCKNYTTQTLETRHKSTLEALGGSGSQDKQSGLGRRKRPAGQPPAEGKQGPGTANR